VASVNTTTTTVTTTNNRQGTQLVVQSQANTVSIGSVVTDVSIQPYIAPRIVSFFAYNLRPSCRVHIFFDSVNVDAYCAPGVVPTTIADSSDYHSITKNGNWGDAIYTDSLGRVAGQFNIPAATFKTGDRVLQICNVDNITQGNNAIVTAATATFTASNLNVTKENVTLTTINPELSFQNVVQTVVTSNTTVTITNNPDIYNFTATWNEPVAQGLTINTPNGDAGVFASSIDVYFKQKSLISNTGVTLYLCETQNGYPNGAAILPFSTVHLDYANVNVSADATAATRFVFESPVFLASGMEYAFIVKPDANDPDYFIYSARLGDLDLTTGTQVHQQPAVGTAFYGATMGEWTALQDEYLKFQLNICNFTSASGNATFKNHPMDFLTVYNVAYSNTSNGMLPGDHIFQATNSTPSTANTSKTGIFSGYDPIQGIVYVANSTGNFSGNSFIQVHRFANNSLASSPNTSTIVAWANTGTLHNVLMDAMVGQFATIVPPGTTLNYFMTGTSNSYGVDGTENKIVPGYETEFFDKERIVASRSNEVALMSSNKSFSIRTALSTDTGLLSPLIDTVRRQQLIIGNKVDPLGWNYEEFFTTGNAVSKIISRIVTLADGNDSQDLQVHVTAYKPAVADIQVWVRFVNGEDPEAISAKVWTPFINSSGSLSSDPANPYDMREFVFKCPKYYGPIPTSGTIVANATSANITGTSTKFTTELKPGWYVNMLATPTYQETTRRIVSIANDTFMILDAPFGNTYTTQPIFLVSPPTTPYLSSNTTRPMTNTSATVATSTTNNAIIGTGTNFTTDFLPGSIITIAGDSQQVVSITNSTYMTVGKPWSQTLAAATGYVSSPAGISYLNSSGSLYTSFKKFQVKIILQSDDSSKVPILDDVQCLAMLL